MTLGIIYMFVIAAVVLMIAALIPLGKESGKRIPLPAAEENVEKKNILARIVGTLPFTKNFLERLNLAVKIKRKLDAAHVPLTPQAYFNLKLVLIVILVIIVFAASGRADPIAFSVPIFFGYFIPDLVLNIKVNKRKQAIVFQLPETVDLLGLCVEGGLDFAAALKWIIEKTPSNYLVEELRILLDEIKLGKSRTQALKDMSKRLNIPEINFFVQTLVQAERMGTSVSDAFRVISEDTRQLRFQRGERMALKAPLKILIPLIFFILPVIAIIIGGPLLLSFMSNETFKGIGQ